MHYLPCFLMSVYIVRELRGQGFGRQLMMKTEEFCHNKGMQHCYLGTTPDIAPMYLKFGYKFCDWRIQTIGSGVSMIPMWCTCDIHVVCMWYPCTVCMWYPRGVHVISMWCACDTHVVCMWYPCGVHVIPLWCACDTHVVCMWYPCGVHVMPMWCVCDTHLKFEVLWLEDSSNWFWRKYSWGGWGIHFKGGTGMSGGQDLLFTPLPPFRPPVTETGHFASLPFCPLIAKYSAHPPHICYG